METKLLTCEVYHFKHEDGCRTYGFRITRPETGQIADSCSGYEDEERATAELHACLERFI